MSILSVAALEVKRPEGSFTRVDRLTSASLELDSEVIQGALSSNWRTTSAGLMSWTLSVDAQDTDDDTGLTAAVAAARNGEVLEIEAVLGDGRRVSGSALATVSRGGAVEGAFGAQINLIGSGKLCGIYEETYPTAPANLQVLDTTSYVELGWDKVESVDGYYVYWGTREGGGYPFWDKIPVADLDDSDNPTWKIFRLSPNVRYWFTVTSYTD